MLTYVDAPYAPHDYMIGRTVSCMAFGWGLVHAKPSKQKLNTKISTESEVIRSKNYIPFSACLDMYMEHKGYRVKRNQFMQDNMSAIKMERNGQNSCTGNSRHINIRDLFVNDRVYKKEIEIVYCPTKVTLDDYFTKPL